MARNTAEFKNLVSGSSLPGFDPVAQFIRELQATYGDFALFLFDEFGGDVISVVWKPAAFLPTAFKVSTSAFKLPLSGEFPPQVLSSIEALTAAPPASGDTTKKKKSGADVSLVLPNIVEMISTFWLLGKDLVQDVVVQ